ncbi:MAG: TMEM175 family protein [Acetobacteraceae bacterium]
MSINYNPIAGHSVERLAALSDGIFAVAMTLLVLDLRLPVVATIHAEAELGCALLDLAPHLLVYLMSFLTLGIFWVGQQTQLNHLVRTNRDLAWIHLGFLFAVTLMPFSTGLIGSFITYRVALLAYWANILLLGIALFASWRYAARARLVSDDAPAGIGRAVERRIVIAQALYAFGAVLCVVGTTWSLGFIVLVQINYVLAPRILGLDRI